MELTGRELATVLAALRFWQRHGPRAENSAFDRIDTEEQYLLNAIRTDLGRFEDLSTEDIDDLCARLIAPAWRRTGKTGGPHVICSVCKQQAAARTAHLHQGEWIGDECCWTEQLRSSE